MCTRDLQPLLLCLRLNVQEKARVGKTTWTCMGTRGFCRPGRWHCSVISLSSTHSLGRKTREDKGAYGSSKISSMPGTEPASTRHPRMFDEGTSHSGSFLQS